MVQARLLDFSHPPPWNFRYALVSQGQNHLPVFHLYRDSLNTFVIKGSAQRKEF